MPEEGYDVLRLIEHNQYCYVSSEYVEGRLLVKWLKYHPQMEKAILFSWMRAMVRQLAQFHRCRGEPCYQYVNPYSIIVTKSKEIYFLDMGAESNGDALKRTQRRVVREYFLPPEEPYYQTASVELDLYGLGRTFQYLLSETECEPRLQKGEIAKLQKIISRCVTRHSKRSFQKVSDIFKYIPEYKSEKNKQKGRILSLLAGGILLLTTALFLAKGGERSENPERQNKTEEEKENEKDADIDTDSQYQMELGVLYFLEFKDYGKSREYFQMVRQGALAEHMTVIAECLAGDKESDDRLRRALKGAYAELEKSEQKSLYYPCLIRGYSCLEREEDVQALLKMGQEYLELDSSEGTPQEEVIQKEVLSCMALAYEKAEESEKAVVLYEDMLTEAAGEEREEIYKKIAKLYLDLDEGGKAQEKLREGIHEFQQSAELRMQYIKIQLQDTGIDRVICRQTIEETLTAVPDMESDAEFQKLLKENGFAAEGGRVWEKE